MINLKIIFLYTHLLVSVLSFNIFTPFTLSSIIIFKIIVNHHFVTIVESMNQNCCLGSGIS